MSTVPPTTGRQLDLVGSGRPSPRRVLADLGPREFANALIALVFSATGPVAVILAAGGQGELTPAQLSSWIFGVFFANGLLTIIMSWAYRTPLAFFWTIPGTVIVGNSLGHLRWSEVLGAYVVTGVVILLVGLSGLARRLMDWIPMPIIMAMVAGVFLRFGLGLVEAVWTSAAVALPMAVAFLAVGAVPRLARIVPPILAAMIVGIAAVVVAGGLSRGIIDDGIIAAPMLQSPEFTLRAMTELVVPLAITVLVVQNGQGIAVLRAKGHRPPVSACAVACGVWSLLVSAIGAVSTCLTGPTNALLVSSGERSRHYAAAIANGALALVVGVVAPAFVGLILGTPAAFIAALGGLAMLAPLQSAFVTAFRTDRALGPLVCLLVTVADVSLLGVSAPFWGIVLGMAVSALLERRHPA
ncbi:benzoate transporter [Dietzia natronolimnaea]|uniref:Benzoate transporter n=1 Tax=Dietzia natronolimnaea TaxID=161920 RepID=A0A2A2WPC6_9ACTN|nr:benzoate/H(+) symporter BenE family transporter [Dietzia natronolimnaea]PAY23021.1 benzoate transporter [Dietzia natronolimnaea]